MTSSMFDTALRIVTELCLPVFPCSDGVSTNTKIKAPLVQGGFQSATKDLSQVEAWWGRFPSAAIGVPTGMVSGIVALDIDVRPNKDGEVSLLNAGVELTNSWQVRTPTGGRHVFFRCPEKPVQNRAGNLLGEGVDFRGDGGYVIFCGSLTADGLYKPIAGLDPWTSDLEELPEELLVRLLQSSKSLTDKHDGVLFEGQRNVGLFSLASKLAESGVTGDSLTASLIELNEARCVPPLDRSEVEGICRSACKRNNSGGIPLTDLGNSERFIRSAAGNLFFCTNSGSWLSQRKGIYQFSETVAYENAKTTISGMTDEVMTTNEPQALLKWIKSSQAAPRIEAMIKLSQKDSRMAKSFSDMDTQDALLSVNNGLLDLDTQLLTEPSKKTIITKKATPIFDPSSSCERWIKFIEEITDDDKVLAGELQKAVGYTLSGRTDAQVFFVCQGSGANGKSIFLEMLTHLMGTYSGKISASALISGQASKIPNELASLVGARFVTISEMPNDQIVNTTILKELTGQDTVSARFLYKEFFQFKPRFKLWVATNQPLRFSEYGHALSRRMITFNFPVFFAPEERDPNLLEHLKSERNGILNWALLGYQNFVRDGLLPPSDKTVQSSVISDNRDAFWAWFHNHYTNSCSTEWVSLDTLTEEYSRHLGMQSTSSMLRRNVRSRLQENGYVSERKRIDDTRRVVAFIGISKKTYQSPF